MKMAIVVLAALTLGWSAGPVWAEKARTIATVNMRASPGASYSIIDVVPRGALINARYCISNGWCRVKWRGNRGWINGRYLRTQLLKRKV